MDENNRDDKYMRLIKWGFILMIIAYVAVVLGVTIYQINRGDYNIDDFVFNFFGGLIVIPFFIVLLFIIGGVMTIVEKITKKKATTPRKQNLGGETFKDKYSETLETIGCFLAIAAVIVIIILAKEYDIVANIVGMTMLVIYSIVGIFFIVTIFWGGWGLVRKYIAPKKSKFEVTLITIALFILLICLLALVGYLSSQLHMPHINDAHFDRL